MERCANGTENSLIIWFLQFTTLIATQSGKSTRRVLLAAPQQEGE